MKHRYFERVESVLRDATGKEFTGAVARIESKGNLVFERAYGTTRNDALARPVYVDTRFDLASLTKLFVATVALRLIADGKLNLDDSPGSLIEEWTDEPYSEITTRMLLAHTSGMNSGADYRTIASENVERFTLGRDLIGTPGESVVYSDLGFIALGIVIARVTGRGLAAAAGDVFPSTTLGYRPSAPRRAGIPATEEDDWRGRVQGFVHDEKAYLMGGVAGHAGLFGTAADVAALTEAYLGPICARANPLLPIELIREAVCEQAYDPVLRRGLGWALKTRDDNSCGRLMDASSFGHTGFVGTCVWADPVRDVQGILLTNSVYFGRNDTRDLRAAFYEAMVTDVENASP